MTVDVIASCGLTDYLSSSTKLELRAPASRFNEISHTWEQRGVCVMTVLEFDSASPGRTDISVVTQGDDQMRLLISDPCSLSPSLTEWLTLCLRAEFAPLFEGSLIVEFDHDADSPKLAGLFPDLKTSNTDIPRLLAFTTACLSCNEHGASLDDTHFLKRTVCGLGTPKHIGLFKREHEILKFVILTSPNKIPDIIAITEEYYAEALAASGVSANQLERTLRKLLEPCLIAVCFDYLVDKEMPSSRICFEVLPRLYEQDLRGRHAALQSAYTTVHQDLNLPSTTDIHPFLPSLPRGFRRVTPIADQKTHVVFHNHSKICMAPSGLSIKEYIGVSNYFR